MEKETKFVSLFDYLGYAAGGDLGKAVYAKAKETKQPVQQKDVSVKSFTGKVLLYTEAFLDEYFKPEIVYYIDDNELPPYYKGNPNEEELPF
jgi:hypothetical protein